VLLVAHNQAAELRRAIQALERSRDRDQIEMLLVDSGSSDSTPGLADEFPGITMQRLPQNFGATKALNIATRTARAEFVFLLSPEIEVEPDTVARLTEVLESNRDLTGVCPLLVDGAGQPVARTRRFPDRESLAAIRRDGELPWEPVPPENLTKERYPVLYPGREALLVRRQFVAGMNYFDERFGEYWADADLAIKIRQAGRRVETCTGIRAIWHPREEPAPSDPIYRSDRILGAARLLAKHDGFVAGFGFRVAAIFGALIRFDFSLLSALLSGKQVGSQAK
jgi:GT2 family glycosyltransferase